MYFLKKKELFKILYIYSMQVKKLFQYLKINLQLIKVKLNQQNLKSHSNINNFLNILTKMVDKLELKFLQNIKLIKKKIKVLNFNVYFMIHILLHILQGYKKHI